MILLVDDNLKGMAEVLGIPTCVKILDLLALKDLAVSDIARELGMKLNTVDYNVRKLVKAGLIEKTGHWWSAKGKRMPIYRVVDRRIVISPRRRVAGKVLMALGFVGVLGVFLRGKDYVAGNRVGVVMDEAVFAAAPKAMELVANDGGSGAQMMASNAGITQGFVDSVSNVSFWGSFASWEWFLFGVWSALVLFFVYAMIADRRRLRL